MMKKLSISVCLFLTLMLVSCGSKDSESNVEQTGGVEVKNETYGNNRGSSLEEGNDDFEEVPVFNIMKIVNKNEADVEEVLGSPSEKTEEEFTYIESGEKATSCITEKYCKGGLDVSVVFVDGAARRIFIKDQNMTKEDFNPTLLLEKIGLEEKPYTSRFRNSIRWQNVYVLYEVSIDEDIDDGEMYVTVITDKRFR